MRNIVDGMRGSGGRTADPTLVALCLALAAQPGPAVAAEALDSLQAAMTFGRTSGGDTAGTANAQPGILLVDCIINGVPQTGVVEVEVRPDRTLVLPIEVWREARLREPDATVAMGSGGRGVVLDQLAGVTYRLDLARLTLAITASPDRFASQQLASRDLREHGRPRTGTGAFIDYDMSVTAADDGAVSYGGAVRTVLFSPKGSIVAGAIVSGRNRGPEPRIKVLRTETYWQLDLPERRQSIVVGDAISQQSAWSRQVRFGGLRWSRNFAVAPDMLTYPLPSLEGTAALPSTADILLDGNTVRRGISVAPGPFAINHLPAISGDGRVNLVVRDPTGVETVISRDFYVSPRLLSPGLSDFSFEVGALRRGFGLTDDGYGPGFAAASWRQGLTPHLTIGGRVELQHHRQAAGIEFDATIGSLAAIQGAAAWSSRDAQVNTPARQGGHYLVGVERTTRRYSLFARGEWFDDGFSQFGDFGLERKPRSRLQAGASVRLGSDINMSLRYLAQTWRDGNRHRLLAANIGVRLGDGWRINAYGADMLTRGQGWSAGLVLSRSFDGLFSARAGLDRAENGKTDMFVSASQAAPSGDGLGWHAEATTQQGGMVRAGVIANTPVGQFNGEAVAGERGSAVRLAARGSVGWLAGLPFASREIGDRAFAVVQVDGLAGVPVLRSNQQVARTNSRGAALVTGLLPYEANDLAVQTTELPLDVEITRARITAVPFARSGMVVDMPVRRSRQALVKLVTTSGAPIPVGARVTLNGGRTFLAGRDGAVWLEGLATANRLDAAWEGAGCTVSLPELTDNAQSTIGPLPCR